jgi:hypothetical protein
MKRVILLAFLVMLASALSCYAVANNATAETGSQNEDLLSFPKNIHLPMRVRAGLRIDNIENINQDEVFSSYVKLRLIWKDSRLRFDVWKQGGKTKVFVNEEAKTQLSKMWNPGIQVDNLGIRQDSFHEKGTGLIIHYNGYVEYIQVFFAEFKVNYNLTAFPFDTQHLNIDLISPRYTLSEIILSSDQQDIDFSGLSQDVDLREWRFSPLEFEESSFFEWDRRLHSKLSISLNAKRSPSSYVYTILMPLFLIFLTNYTLVIYFDDYDLEKNITTIGANLLAMIALDFTVSISYPSLEGNSIVILMFFIGYIYSWVLVLISFTLLNPPLSKYIASSYTLSEIALFLKWSTPLFLIIIITYVIAGS